MKDNDRNVQLTTQNTDANVESVWKLVFTDMATVGTNEG